MKLKCYFEDCENIWDYNGEKDNYVTCTDCHRSIRKDKARKKYQKEEVDNDEE